eukprot:5070978-Alexandrium_andersonii.AAC.1
MSASLVGSEMCIRDRPPRPPQPLWPASGHRPASRPPQKWSRPPQQRPAVAQRAGLARSHARPARSASILRT